MTKTQKGLAEVTHGGLGSGSVSERNALQFPVKLAVASPGSGALHFGDPSMHHFAYRKQRNAIDDQRRLQLKSDIITYLGRRGVETSEEREIDDRSSGDLHLAANGRGLLGLSLRNHDQYDRNRSTNLVEHGFLPLIRRVEADERGPQAVKNGSELLPCDVAAGKTLN